MGAWSEVRVGELEVGDGSGLRSPQRAQHRRRWLLAALGCMGETQLAACCTGEMLTTSWRAHLAAALQPQLAACRESRLHPGLRG